VSARIAFVRRARRWGIVLACATLAVLGTPQRAITRGPSPDHCIEPNRRMTLYAEELPRTPDGKPRLGYGLTPATASTPGPTIEMLEGDCIAITLVNDVSAATLAELRDDPLLGSRDPSMPLGVSLHVHGVKYTKESDGTLGSGVGDSFVPPGKSRTYIWYAAPRILAHGRTVSLGTAGYWWYHDHVAGTSHGTGGLGSGLFGAVVVRRAHDPKPAHTYVLGFGPNATINLRRWPDTDCPGIPNRAAITEANASNNCLVAKQGQLIEIVALAFGDDFHTFHLHAHNWANTRNGLVTSPAEDDVALIDNRTLGPADSFGFMVTAGEESGPGNWMLHCHVQRHSDLGMVTFLHVLTPSGVAIPQPMVHFGHHAGAHGAAH
jgi:FtsP/CotA-like multicopper oxidase with cupredoxin domain